MRTTATTENATTNVAAGQQYTTKTIEVTMWSDTIFLCAALLVIIVLTPVAAAIIMVHCYLLTGYPPLDRWVREFARRVRDDDD
jgi:hypothetical protein